MRKIESHDGLLVDASTTPPTCCGYIFDFGQGRIHDPSGPMAGITPEQITQHNQLLAAAELAAIRQQGRGTLYVTITSAPDQTRRNHVPDSGSCTVSSWSGALKIPGQYKRTRRGFGGESFDVWFTWDGEPWYGINQGDSQLLRVRRVKR